MKLETIVSKTAEIFLEGNGLNVTANPWANCEGVSVMIHSNEGGWLECSSCLFIALGRARHTDGGVGRSEGSMTDEDIETLALEHGGRWRDAPGLEQWWDFAPVDLEAFARACYERGGLHEVRTHQALR